MSRRHRKSSASWSVSKRGPSNRRGMMLLLATVIVMVAMMTTYSYTDLMQAYDESARAEARRQQASQLVESGVSLVTVFLAQTPAQRDAQGVLNNPQLFQANNVVQDLDGDARGSFSIVAPGMDEQGRISGLRFGLQNESDKIHLNALPAMDALGDLASAAGIDPTLGGSTGAASGSGAGTGSTRRSSTMAGGGGQPSTASQLLMGLPYMTQELSDAILDFIDEDDTPRPFGCEREYYGQLQPAYAPKNGPLDSLEELLLVRGVTPTLLFGFDRNRNGLIDPYERPAGGGTTTMSNGGDFAGWSSYFTLYSVEANRRADGTLRVNINSADLEKLYKDLKTAFSKSQWADNWASFIVAYRMTGQPGGGGLAGSLLGGASGGSTGGPSGGPSGQPPGGAMGGIPGGQGGGGGQGGEGGAPPQPWQPALLERMNIDRGGGVTATQILDLINATVTIEGQTYSSPFVDTPIAMADYLPYLMANLSTQSAPTLPGRINIMHCPAEVMAGLPGMNPTLADQLVKARGSRSTSENRKYETWPMVEGYVTTAQMRQLLPFVTTGGDAFRAQIVGYYEGIPGYSRAEVVFDSSRAKPQILFWRNLTHLGRGFDVATLGISSADPLVQD
jgi:hypothetical protein